MAQKSITSFFKPVQDNKRKILEDASDCVNKKFFSDAPKAANDAPISSLQGDIADMAKKVPALSVNIGPSWFLALKNEFSKPYFHKLSDFIVKERKAGTIYPPQDEVFSWTRFCKINEVKVIILGQDPYHGPNQAHGLCFSVKKGVAPPPSLLNIYKAVKHDYPGFERPTHGELIGWAEQGVLLLNACLTVRAAQANSHANHGWENLTDAVIKHLSKTYKNRVFLLWGSYAQKKGDVIDKKQHLVLKSVHPSPLSAHRGFLECGHFKQANEYLTKHGLKPIDWTKLELTDKPTVSN